MIALARYGYERESLREDGTNLDENCHNDPQADPRQPLKAKDAKLDAI